MVKKCDPKYKNLNYIQSFSEQGYATLQLMQQACMNDEWLRQKVLKLGYLTPPATRIRMSDFKLWVDPLHSYGYAIDADGNIVFDSPKTIPITVDFVDDDDKIDWQKTDAVIVSYNANEQSSTLTTHIEDATVNYTESGHIITSYDSNGNITDTTPDLTDVNPDIVNRCQLPYEKELSKKTYVTSPATDAVTEQTDYMGTLESTHGGVNSAWYVGFDKAKNYYIRPDWLKKPNGWKDIDIPAVCRGQTFKATKSGKLKSIDLKLDYTGHLHSDCGSPLYVQIWGTTNKTVQKTQWNNTTKQVEYVWKVNNKNGEYKKDPTVRYKQLNEGEPKRKGETYYRKSGNNYIKDNTNGTYYRIPDQYVKLKSGETRKSGVTYYSKVMEKIAYPDTKNYGIWKPMAQGVYNPSSMSSFEVDNIVFDKQCEITKGHSYFIALFSPLSEWKHCPRWGGWGRNCKKDKKYEYGHAFVSENNGRTWSRFGRNDYSVDYKYGRYVPQDFAFRVNVITREAKDAQDAQTVVDDLQFDDDERYLYLKPILSNPIKSIQLTATDHGSQTSESTEEIEYEYSTKGAEGTWNVIKETHGRVPISPPSRTLFFRAKLSTKNVKNTPYIEYLNLQLETTSPTEMYARTNMYIPPLSGSQMLGANIWGRVFAPYTLDVTTDCKVELVTNNVMSEYYTIIEIGDLLSYMETYGLSTENITDKTEIGLCEYLNKHRDILTYLKSKNIYIKPYSIEDKLYKLSFTPESTEDNIEDMLVVNDGSNDTLSGFKIKGNAGYPIVECQLQPLSSTDNVRYFGEWFDFLFDYDENILTFHKYILEEMPVGTLKVNYNEVFIEGLTNVEVGVHTDGETGLREEGLLLDYFKETFTITSDQVSTRRVKLKVNPLDPIREVVLNRDSDNEIELFEDWHYKLDIDNNELIFQMDEDVSTSILTEGDKLEVVYTPNLTATGLSVGYYATRTNTDMQVHIKNGYLEYKS